MTCLALSSGPPGDRGQGVTITGYASLFDVPDASGDIIRRGAFLASLARRSARGIAMLWQHDASCPIGIWTAVNEDPKGLRVTGRLLAGVTRAREAATLIGAGALSGLSIGFRPRRAHRSVDGRRRTLFDIDLWEISLVTFPQAEGARVRLLTGVTSRKSGRPHGAVRAICARRT